MRSLYINATIFQQTATKFSVLDGHFEAFYEGLPEGTFDEVIDLNHDTVLPGFNDSHGHFLGLMYIKRQISLDGVHTLAGIKELIAEENTLVRASRFNELGFETNALLDRVTLDRLRNDIPVLVLRVCGHILMANSKATAMIKDAVGLKGPNSKYDFARGIFYEDAISEALHVFLDPSQADIEDDLKAGETLCFEEGITSFQTDDFITYPVPYERIINAYAALSDTLKIRIQQQCHLNTLELMDDFLAKGYAHAQYGRAVMGPSKLLVDGSLGGKTAAMHAPYVDTDNTGILNFDQATLEAYITRLNAADMDLSWHAIGDRASDVILNAIEAVPLRDTHRHALIHAQLTGKAEITKMERLNVGAMIQPIFLDDDIPILDHTLGAKASDTYLFKTLYDTVPTALSTDAPIVPLSPLRNIYTAVTRKSIKHPRFEAHLENQALSIEEAIDGYTQGGAYFMRDDQLGALRPGYKADFTVIKHLDLTDIESFLTAKVVMTTVHGERVFERSSA